MYCVMCGAKQEPAGNFCALCGAKMAHEVPPDDLPQVVSPPVLPAGESIPPLDLPLEEGSPAESEIEIAEPEVFFSEESSATAKSPPPEMPSASRKKKVWIPGLILIGILALALVWGWQKRLHPVAPAVPAVQKMAEPTPPSLSPPPAAIDPSSRNTIGKMAAILEGIQRYAEKNHGSLPPSLSDLNHGYSRPETRQDGWGHDIYYLADLLHQSFLLRSAGPDGMRETADDLTVSNEDVESWLSKNEQVIQDWKTSNPSQYAQLKAVGPSVEELKKLEDARKAEENRKHQEAFAVAESRRQEEEKRRQEQLRQDEEKKRLQEQARKEEEQREARAREEAAHRQQELLQSMNFTDDFSAGLNRWDAPEGWVLFNEKQVPFLRVQGLGLLKDGENWENYQVEFEIRIDKEAGGWLVRARDTRSFYFFKLSSEKAKAVPKNALIRYVLIEGKYLNPLQQDEAPGAAAITPLKFKIRAKDFYTIRVMAQGRKISTFIDGNPADSFEDDTFPRGRFGFNASSIESATIRRVTIRPLH
jgi:hypothetical protein